MTDEELEREIEKVKQMLSDYRRLEKMMNPTKEEYERQINILLERLSNLLKKRN